MAIGSGTLIQANLLSDDTHKGIAENANRRTEPMSMMHV